MLKKWFIIMGVMVALFPTTTQAQSNRCNVDLGTVAALIFQAQAGFSSGDNQTGLDRLSQAQALISAVQTSCTDATSPTATPPAVNTETPSIEEPTATAPPVVEDDQLYQSPDGVFSAKFPASWISSSNERSVLIGTSQPALVALSMVTNPLGAGERGATIVVNQPDVLVPNAQTIAQIIQFYQQLFNSELSVNVGGAQDVEINGQMGRGFRYTTAGYSGFLLVVPLDDEEMLLMFMIAPLGEDISLPAEAINLAKNVSLGVEEPDEE